MIDSVGRCKAHNIGCQLSSGDARKRTQSGGRASKLFMHFVILLLKSFSPVLWCCAVVDISSEIPCFMTVLISSIMCLTSLSICLSVCLFVWAPNSIRKRCRKSNAGVSILNTKGNRCAKFLLKRLGIQLDSCIWWLQKLLGLLALGLHFSSVYKFYFETRSRMISAQWRVLDIEHGALLCFVLAWRCCYIVSCVMCIDYWYSLSIQLFAYFAGLWQSLFLMLAKCFYQLCSLLIGIVGWIVGYVVMMGQAVMIILIIVCLFVAVRNTYHNICRERTAGDRCTASLSLFYLGV